ncbi:MAG TPA: Fe-S cluster assembly ATPase SufC [Dehalococcoidia bacterium]|nr:Fe-S cluster assembly ATPase SufC [Dehalococcoidia bacterium]
MPAAKQEPLLQVKNLHVSVEDNEILKGLDLTVNLGEVHAIMGPNGSGKSTLTNVIAGRPGYQVTKGSVLYKGRNLLDMPPDERAREGIFLAFQYPVELPGVRTREFLRTAINALREHRGEEKLPVRDFNKLLDAKAREVELSPELTKRSVNEGFSGGEKKRNEILQMTLLDPTLALLDETDSGLDIDALRVVSEGVNRARSESKAIVLVTHYQRILNYITPDYVHVLIGGRIELSGGRELALELESRGYEWIKEAVEKSDQVSV